jgi:hypothetical protein
VETVELTVSGVITVVEEILELVTVVCSVVMAKEYEKL